MVPDREEGAWCGFYVFIAVVSVSFAAILVRMSQSHPFVIGFYRLGLASLILLPYVLVKHREELFGLDRRELMLMTLIGFVLSLHFSAFFYSLKMTTVASSVILVSAHPLFVGLAAQRFFGEKLGTLNLMGVLAGLLGLFLLFSGDLRIGRPFLLGDLLALLGGVFAGLYILGGRRIRRETSLAVYVTVVYGVCAIFMLLFSLAVSRPVWPVPPGEWVLFGLMVLVPTYLGHTLLNLALRYLPARLISTALLGEPLGSAILAFVIFSEVPPGLAIVGGAVLLVGIYAGTRRY